MALMSIMKVYKENAFRLGQTDVREGSRGSREKDIVFLLPLVPAQGASASNATRRKEAWNYCASDASIQPACISNYQFHNSTPDNCIKMPAEDSCNRSPSSGG